ncbi:MAG TPA: signal peptide peptidase SppA [Oculatellaceae cyanobacterium]|jgi:protease-4
MRDFFKQSFASLVGTLAGLFLFFSLGTVGLVVLLIAASFKTDEPIVKDKSVLVFDLSTNITDSKSRSSTSEAISEALSGEDNNSVTLRTVLNALDKASKDKRIVALYLDGSSSETGNETGFATLKEVRQALERFRASGKKIIAYNVDLEKREYYLSSVADTIVINPMGVMELNGLSSQTMFLAGAFQKYGVGIQVLRVGKFKSAVEPYIRTQFSPESKLQTQVLLNDLWSEFIGVTAKSRKLTTKQLQAIADSQGSLSAQEAKSRRLVDKVAYYDEVVAELKKLTDNRKDNQSFPKVSISSYAQAPNKGVDERSSENKIAVIYAEGEIVDGEGSSSSIGGDRFAKQMRELRLDKDVKAVVLRVNSPGGSATASDVIQREVRLTQKAKPVIVSMGDVAASGGYWISTYSNRIFAEPNTITGSIGVFGLLLNVQKLAKNNGISWDTVKTSKLAGSETVARPRTPQELAISQRFVNQVYNQFLTKVSESRKLPKLKVAEIAQGRVWSGKQALKLGLVDQLGGLDEAIKYAAKQAKLGNDWEIEDYPKSRSFEERILKSFLGEESAKQQQTEDPLTAELSKLKSELDLLKVMNDPRGIYARLPFNLKID